MSSSSPAVEVVPLLPESVEKEAQSLNDASASAAASTSPAAERWDAACKFDELGQHSDDLVNFDQFSAFEGVKFELNRQVTTRLGVSHVLSLVPPQPAPAPNQVQTTPPPKSSYALSAIVADQKQESFLVTKIDNALDLFARAQVQLHRRVAVRAVHQSGTEDSTGDYSLELECKPHWSSLVSAKYVNQAQVHLAATQTLSRGLVAGAQLIYAAEHGPMINAGLRYTSAKSQLAPSQQLENSQVSPQRHVSSVLMFSSGAVFNFAHSRRVSERFSLGADVTFFASPPAHPAAAPTVDSMAAAGMEYRLANALVKCKVDTRARVGVYVEEMLNPMLQLKMSGQLDHQKEEYRFGFGVAAHT